MIPVEVEARFWSKVDRRGPNECWPWCGPLGNGYGLFVAKPFYANTQRAHRVAYELMVGPIPEGLHIDHLCRNRGCVNPAHMEPVTCAENVLRGVGFGAINRAKTHCPQGHAYDAANTYINKNGRRQCRACSRDRHRLGAVA